MAEESRNEEIISSAFHFIRKNPERPDRTPETSMAPAMAATPPRRPFAAGQREAHGRRGQPPA